MRPRSSFQPNWDQGFTKDQFAVLACPAWMLGHIQKTGRWQLLENPTPAAEEFVRKLESMSSGTAVVVE